MRKRLPKAERREQLLETALRIVREGGTDALTLGQVAERAGVTKPIAYEHFRTRSGLLIALAKRIDDQQVALLVDALKRARPRLEQVARVAAGAYLHCYATVGPQWNAITAALLGDEEMDAFQRELVENYVRIFRDAFAPFVRLAGRELHLRCLAIVGAADGLAREMLRGHIDEATAARTVASLIVAWLSPG